MEVVKDYPDTRFGVALNKTVPIEVLRELARDKDSRVRSMVAPKNKATADILASLADDEDEGIHQQVAGHTNTPTEVVVPLLEDSWEEVRQMARWNLARRGHSIE
ncbi:hypothetical protein J5X84_33030 [Streptosporangiaceae bacterium NEAU-GS5]|nr:hypothetical protein [Streptosporangiaceae bacterium NEAU-GS5]